MRTMKPLTSKNEDIIIYYEPILKSGLLDDLFLIEYEFNSTFEGAHLMIGNQATLKRLIDGDISASSHPKLEYPYMLIKQKSLDLIEKYGKLPYLAQLDNQDPTKYISKNLKEDLENPEYTIIEMIDNPNLKFAWRDLKGKLHCEPFILNQYIMSELDNIHYHLDEFAEKLSQRHDVAFITYTERWSDNKSTLLFAPLKGDEKDIGGVINEITHHLEEGDAEPLEKEEINLIFYPNSENIEKVLFFAQNVEGRTSENTRRHVFFVERFIVRDILGGEEFYIDPNPPIEEKPKRKFKH